MKRKDYLYSIILDQNTPELRKEFEDLGYSEMVGTGLAFNPIQIKEIVLLLVQRLENIQL